MDAYFGPNGIEYTVGRIPMGSCDFSVEEYSFDDVPGDYNLTHFDDGVERDSAQRVRQCHGRWGSGGAGGGYFSGLFTDQEAFNIFSPTGSSRVGSGNSQHLTRRFGIGWHDPTRPDQRFYATREQSWYFWTQKQ